MKKLSCIIVIIFSIACSACTNYGNVGLPRGYNGRIVHIVNGSTPFAFIVSMYGQPAHEDVFADGSKHSFWELDTSSGPCTVVAGFTTNGIVLWHNFVYQNAIQRR